MRACAHNLAHNAASSRGTLGTHTYIFSPVPTQVLTAVCVRVCAQQCDGIITITISGRRMGGCVVYICRSCDADGCGGGSV